MKMLEKEPCHIGEELLPLESAPGFVIKDSIQEYITF